MTDSERKAVFALPFSARTRISLLNFAKEKNVTANKQVKEPLYGVSSTDAYARAEHYSKYSHRNWIVWESADGFNCAEISSAAIDRAIADVGPDGRIVQVAGAAPRHIRVGAGTALIWKSNLEAGHYYH